MKVETRDILAAKIWRKDIEIRRRSFTQETENNKVERLSCNYAVIFD